MLKRFKNKLPNIAKGFGAIIGGLIFWTIAAIINYIIYYYMLSDVIKLSLINFIGIYAIILQFLIVIKIFMKNDK